MGGSMAYAMACAAADVIRGVAVHSGGPMSGCVAHDAPIAYFMTHGTADDICTYPGYGVPELQDFAAVNGCASPDPSQDLTGFVSGLPEPNSQDGVCIDLDGCAPDHPVRSCIFVGDHRWNPGGGSSWVPGEVWDFFSRF
jgi:poly(3-hydroxybutyrate) depolymerase